VRPARRSRATSALVNQYASEHSLAIAGGVPILALDMYEHAYHIDYGANAKAYVDTFMRNLDWKSTEQRYEDAMNVNPPRPLEQPEFGDLPAVSVEEVKAMLDAGKPVQFMDARPRHFVSRSRTSSKARPGAIRTRAGLDRRALEVGAGRHILRVRVYIGCKTAIALREAGFDASFMKGGHSAWRAIGAPVKQNV